MANIKRYFCLFLLSLFSLGVLSQESTPNYFMSDSRFDALDSVATLLRINKEKSTKGMVVYQHYSNFGEFSYFLNNKRGKLKFESYEEVFRITEDLKKNVGVDLYWKTLYLINPKNNKKIRYKNELVLREHKTNKRYVFYGPCTDFAQKPIFKFDSPIKEAKEDKHYFSTNFYYSCERDDESLTESFYLVGLEESVPSIVAHIDIFTSNGEYTAIDLTLNNLQSFTFLQEESGYCGYLGGEYLYRKICKNFF